MTHKLATLAVRFLGLFLVVFSLPAVGRAAHDTFQAFCMGNGLSILSPFIEYSNDQEVLRGIGSFTQFVLGLYLFLSGRWVIAKLLRGLEGACPRCGYDISGNTSGRCPECGAKLPSR